MNHKVKVMLLLSLVLLLAGCGKKDTSDISENTEHKETASTEMPVDIVTQVTEEVTAQTEALPMDDSMDESIIKNYTVLLDGYSDSEAGYYLVDVTGDGVPELMIGNETVTVYSCNQGSVMTIGTLDVREAWLSGQYGFLGVCENNGAYELRQYQYDGEMFNEKVLVSAADEASCSEQSASYLSGAQELVKYDISDRTPLE
jgi:hypothetical protein